MKKILAALIIAVAAAASAQVNNPSIISVSSAPSGACTNGLPNQQVISTGVQYSCQSSTWEAIGGSGSGTALSVNGGSALTAANLNSTTPSPDADLSPIFFKVDGSGNTIGEVPLYAVNLCDPPDGFAMPTCDGTTDDHVAVQAVLDAGFAAVYIPSGGTEINTATTGLTVNTAGETFYGNGQTVAYSGTGSALALGSSASQVNVNNLTIDMTGSTGTPVAFDATHCYICVFDGVQDYSGPAGYTSFVVGDNAIQTRITNSEFGGVGIVGDGDSTGPQDLIISGDTIAETGAAVSLILNHVSNVTVSASDLEGDAHAITASNVNVLTLDSDNLAGGTDCISLTSVNNFNGSFICGSATSISGSATHGVVSYMGTNAGTRFFDVVGKAPVCVDANGVIYAGSNSGVGAPCP